MQNVTLTLKPFHLAQLREAVRARNLIVKTDTTSTVADRAVCADLEERVNLLAQAVATEYAAKEARRKYTEKITARTEINSRRQRKQTAKLTQEQPQEPEQGNNTPADKKPQEQAPEPPQDLPEVPDIPDIPDKESAPNTATLQQRPF